MRNAMLAILALSAATVATVAGSSPAAAYDYPYCLQGRGIGIPGECSYSHLWPVHGVGVRAWRSTAMSIRALPSDSSSSGGCGFIGITDLGSRISSRDGRTEARKGFALMIRPFARPWSQLSNT